MKKDSIWHNKTLIALCIEALVLAVGMGFLSPILPGFVQALGVEQTQIGTMVGLVVTVYGIARVIMDLPAGKLAQRWGRRPLLIIGPALVAISALSCGLATDYWQLVVFRLLQGVGSALFSVAAIIAIGEISPPANRGQFMSLFWGAFLVGLSFGPTLGGFAGEYLGYRAPFFCFAGLASLATLWGYLRIPETKNMRSTGTAKTSSNSPAKIASAKTSPPLYLNLNFILICTVTLFTLFTVSGTQITLIPILGYERLGLTESQVGLTLTVIAIMQLALVFLVGRLSDKLGRKALIVPGSIVTILGLLMFTHSASYRFFLLSALVLGIGIGFGGVIPTAYAADVAPPENYEHTMALYRTMSDLGFVIGPILLGRLKDTSGLDFPFFLSAGLLFGAMILFATLAKETVARQNTDKK
ncbi:MAG: MFS transporter [Dehalococcoidia bacterium]|nr:MFS transporter [Dehalococcoidia bacterium]